MMAILWLAIGLGLGGTLSYRAGQVWLDAGQRGAGLAQRAGWALMGSVSPARYWWGARIETLSASDRDALLASETRALGLSRADSLRCPLCGVEVPHAWSITSTGQPTVAPGPIECPGCDFRLDACRHCTHFLPGLPQTWQRSAWGGIDLTTGRCRRHKASQPVEQSCAPDMARQLRARGYDQIRGPLPITDSFLPPDFCRDFAPERKRLRQGGVRWPDARHKALLRLLAPPPAPETSVPERLPQGDEQWLL